MKTRGSENKGYGVKLEVVYALAKANMPDLPYHNFRHAEDVFNVVGMLCDLEGIVGTDKFIAQTAALLHDVVYVLGASDNEEKSAAFAKTHLPQLGYTEEQIGIVCSEILATKIPTNPKSHLEKVLCDADVDNLGREDFLEKNEAVRKEIGATDLRKWYKNSIHFLEKHAYYTTSAKNLRETGKAYNLQKLKERVP